MTTIRKFIKSEYPTVAEIEAMTGRKVKWLRDGQIVVGTERAQREDNPREMYDKEIRERGIEIEFEDDAIPEADFATLDADLATRNLKKREAG